MKLFTLRSPRWLAAWVLVVSVSISGPALAARPSATELLPKNTVVYLSAADSHELVERFRQTAMGQMAQDPQLKPVLDSLYGAAVKSLATVESRLGVSVSDLLSIPQGEFSLAVVAPEKGQPALVVLLDTGEQNPTVDKLLELGDTQLVQTGAAKQEETVEGTPVTIYQFPGPANRQLLRFRKDGTLVIGSNIEVVKSVLSAWNSGQAETLRDNTRFAAVMSHARPAGAESPQFTWFVDPIGLARGAGQNNPAMQIGLAALPALGLDGLESIGGSLTFATEQFDAIIRLHIMLASPRSGVVDLISFTNGDTTPERWVPADVSSYTTVYWDVQKTYEKLGKLVDNFQGDGTFARQVQQRVNDRAGVDLEKDILAELDGRITLMQLVEQPITPTSQGTLAGLRLKDGAKFQATLEKLVQRFPGAMERKSYGDATYYQQQPAAGGDQQPGRPGGQGRACVGILGNYLLLADRPSLIERAVATNGDSSKSLAGSLEYQLIAGRIGRLEGGAPPGLISFSRPEEGMRFLYGLATAAENRQRLQDAAERNPNPFLKDVNKALEDNPLPPFAVLQQYLAPGGAALIDDETGLHYTSFTLRRKKE